MAQHAPRLTRVVVALCCAGIAAHLAFELFGPVPLFSGQGSGGGRGVPHAGPLRAMVAAAAGMLVVCGAAVASGRRAFVAGISAVVVASVALECLTWGRARLFAEPQLLAVALFGWALGAWVGTRVVAKADSARARDAYGREGALGALGAAWGLAAVSKLRDGGADWLQPGSLWHVMLAGREVPIDRFGAPMTGAETGWLFDGLVGQPAVVGALVVAVLVVELAAPLLAVRGPLRRVVALGLVGVHLGFSVFGGLAQFDVVLLVVLLGLPGDAPLPVVTRPRRILAPAVAAALLLIAAWSLPIDTWLALPSTRRSDAWHIAVPAAAKVDPHTLRRPTNAGATPGSAAR